MHRFAFARSVLCATVAAAAAPLSAHAISSESADYSLLGAGVVSGGGDAGSADYQTQGGIGGISGMAGTATVVNKTGVISQWAEVVGQSIGAATATVPEGGNVRLSAWDILDDSSLLAVESQSIAWSIDSGPLTLTGGDRAMAGVVAVDTLALLRAVGSFGTVVVELTVLDSDKDNFGSYAADQLPDDWQLQHFGSDNPNGSPSSDADGDGHDNRFEFVAGLLPMNAHSAFSLSISPAPGNPAQKQITFAPRLPGRTYTVLSSTKLGIDAEWQPLADSLTVDEGTVRRITHGPNAAATFYRIHITAP